MSSSSIAPTISVRQLDQNHDPIYGNGLQDFLHDLYAVAQLIDTSLLLLQGEWWEDLSIGLPLFQQIIGVAGVSSNPQLAALLIQQTIMSVPYVTGLGAVNVGYDSASRTFNYACVVYTQFGTLQNQFAPGNSATIPV